MYRFRPATDIRNRVTKRRISLIRLLLKRSLTTLISLIPSRFGYNILMRIFLIGPMASGKTTIGQKLAKHLQIDFIDTDQQIEKNTARNLPRETFPFSAKPLDK